MGVINKLYKEVFNLIDFGILPNKVFSTIVGDGMIVYGYDGEDEDMIDIRDFIRKYNNSYTGIHPTIHQLYYLHLKHNKLNILECLPKTSLSYDTERALPTYSSWVSIPDVVAFYEKFSTRKFVHNISFFKK